MKLLFFINGLTGGGAGRVMAILMNKFVEQGHTIRVVCTASLQSTVYELDPRIQQVNMLSGGPSVNSSFFNKIYRHVWKYYAIRKEAQTYNPDIVVSFVRKQNNDVLLALLGTGIKVVIGDHTNVDRKYPVITSVLSNLLYRKASAITMLTQQDYNKWKTRYKQVYYLPNPCEVTLTSQNTSRRKVVLAVGRVYQWDIKGFDNLMRVWNKIKSKYPDWKCQIAGNYNEEAIAQLKRKVTEEEFNSVELLGYRDDVYELMLQSEVFCLPSRFEGMPMALLEALSLGCACVSFNCNTGPSEMIEDNVNGLLVRDQDTDALGEKLERIITDESMRKRFHSIAPLSVQKFSVDNIIIQWNKMLNDILE